MEIITPKQHLQIEAGQGVALWEGRNITALDMDCGNVVEVNAKELLRYHVTECKEDSTASLHESRAGAGRRIHRINVDVIYR